MLLARPLDDGERLDRGGVIVVGGQGQSQSRHDEHADCAGQHERGGEGRAHGVGTHRHLGDGHDDGQSSGGVDGDLQGLAHGVGARAVAAPLQPGGDPHGQAPHEHEQEEEGADGRQRLLRHAQIDPHPGDDEEDRYEEAVGEPVELLLELAVPVGQGVAQDETGGEGPQDDVEVEDLRESAQAHQQQDRDAHRGLRRRRAAQADRLDEPPPGAAHPVGEAHDEEGDGQEDQEDRQAGPGRARPQQKRHEDDRTDFADGAVVEDRRAHRRGQQPPLAQDRQNRADGRGGHGDGDGDAVGGEDPAGYADDGDRREGQAERSGPGGHGVAAAGAAQFVDVDLVAGHEEEEGDAELLEEGDVLPLVGDAQTAGADEDAPGDEQHGLGQQAPGDAPGDEWGGEGDRDNAQQGDEDGAHIRSFPR